MQEYKKIYFLGIFILIVAIIVNIAASAVGLLTWYDFVYQISKLGLKESFLSLSFPSALFLFFVYPAILGYSGHYFYTRF
jgi:hypothetical protein